MARVAVAFFLEATFVGLMLFGWDRLSKRQHLFSTFMVALIGAAFRMATIRRFGWAIFDRVTLHDVRGQP